MQIDLGGIGKEYAVDAAASLRRNDRSGIELPRSTSAATLPCAMRVATASPGASASRAVQSRRCAERVVQLSRGALATSGDSRRFVFRDGHRYSHILDARTGWPVRNAPHSITVAADTCTQAGTLTTLAMLQGDHAERMLQASGRSTGCSSPMRSVRAKQLTSHLRYDCRQMSLQQ